MTGEHAQPGDFLSAYHAIDPTVPVGGLLPAQYEEMRAAYGDVEAMDPADQYNYAWIGLENAIALTRVGNLETGRPHTPQQLQEILESSRIDFRRIARNPNAPLHLKSAAQLAATSVETYFHMSRGIRRAVGNPSHAYYVKGIHATAIEMLAQIGTPAAREEVRLLNSVTALALLNEYAREQGWFVLAAPRQPWDVTGMQGNRTHFARIVMADEAEPGFTPMPPYILGDAQWEGDRAGPFATLRAYTQQQPGFAGRREKNPKFSRRLLDDISDDLFSVLNDNVGNQVRMAEPVVAAATGAIAVRVELEHSQRPEVSWYSHQSAYELRDVSERTLRINIDNLAVLAERGELQPSERRTLGWMLLDAARLRLYQATDLQTKAEQLRIRASQIAGADRPPLLEETAAFDARALVIQEEASNRFDAAATSLATAAESYLPSREGEKSKVLLDIVAFPMYRKLFEGGSFTELTQATEAYSRRLASLAATLRDTARRMNNAPEQLQAVHDTVQRATFCLILDGSSDEAARHLTLPCGERAGGSLGQLDAIVYPIDFAGQQYDTSSPVAVHFVDGSEITHEHRRIHVGRELLQAPKNPLQLLLKMAAVVRASKQSSRKRDTRGRGLDDLTLQIADAVVDATE